jgi:hypothetical protein
MIKIESNISSFIHSITVDKFNFAVKNHLMSVVLPPAWAPRPGCYSSWPPDTARVSPPVLRRRVLHASRRQATGARPPPTRHRRPPLEYRATLPLPARNRKDGLLGLPGWSTIASPPCRRSAARRPTKRGLG